MIDHQLDVTNNSYNIPNNFRGLTLDKTDLVLQKPDDGYQSDDICRPIWY